MTHEVVHVAFVPPPIPTPGGDPRMTSTRPGARCAAVLALTLAAPLAMAHTGADAAHHGLQAAAWAGFSHPFGGADHLLAMVAVGTWSAMRPARVWAAPLAFVSALLAGALMGLAGWALPAVEPMIAASLLALGLLLAAHVRWPATAAAALVAGFALFHGAAHGTELAGAWGGAALAGMVAATALLHATGVGLGRALRSRSAAWPRLAGAAFTLAGATMLWPAALLG
jgi:urease accessory protein